MATPDAKTPVRARLGDRLLGFFGVRLVIFVLAARAFLPGVINDPPWNLAQYHDDHYYVMHDEVARRSYVDYGQIPAWNPWHCGGMIGLEYATSSEVAPEFVLRLLYGTTPGRKLTVLFFVLIGMEGVFRYARKNGASAIGGVTAGIAFACMHHFVTLLGWGWVIMFNYNLIPWLALGFEVGLRKRWGMVAGGAVMAWIIFGGGSYMAPYGTLVLLCLFINETIRAALKLDGEDSVKWWRPAATLAVMAVVAVGLSAIKTIPAIDFIIGHPRGVEQKDLTNPISALGMLVVPSQHGAWIGGAGDFYIGWGIFVLALIALLSRDSKVAKFWGVAAFFFVIGCGEFIENSPYIHLHKLPIFSQLRFPVRMLTLTSLFLALAGSIGLTRIEDAARHLVDQLVEAIGRLTKEKKEKAEDGSDRPDRSMAILAGVAATFVAGWIGFQTTQDVLTHNRIAPGSIYNFQPPLERDQPFRQSRGNRWDAHVWTFTNLGTIHCFEENKVFESPYLRGDLPQEEFGAPDTDTKVERLSWSPHKIVLKVTSSKPGRFIVNMNHHDAWKTDVGEIASDGGLITVRVPAGEHKVTLEYRDWRVRVGGLITFATLLAIAIRGFKRLRARANAARRWWRILPSGNGDKGESDKAEPAK
jgi:hypothetical protein